MTFYLNRATQHSKLEPDLQITLLESLRPFLETPDFQRWRSPSAYSSVGRLAKQQALSNPHSFTKKQVQHIFTVHLVIASAVCPLKLNFCLSPLTPYFLWLRV